MCERMHHTLCTCTLFFDCSASPYLCRQVYCVKQLNLHIKRLSKPVYLSLGGGEAGGILLAHMVYPHHSFSKLQAFRLNTPDTHGGVGVLPHPLAIATPNPPQALSFRILEYWQLIPWSHYIRLITYTITCPLPLIIIWVPARPGTIHATIHNPCACTCQVYCVEQLNLKY